MSKRYGRQQKRKAREQIADLQRQKRILNESLERRTEAEYIAAEIVELAKHINPNAPMFDPKNVDEGVFRWSPIPESIGKLSICSMPRDYQAETFRLIDLYQLELIMKNEPFTDYVHFEVDLTTDSCTIGRSAYRVSWLELQNPNNFDRIHAYVSKALTIEMREATKNVRR